MSIKQSISLKIIIFLFVLSILACGKITEKQPPRKDSTYTLGSDQAVIETTGDMEWVFGKNYKPWTPTESDIQKAENLITQCFNDQKRGTVNRLLNRKPEDYCRQFFGAINEKGEKIIWINCFCKDQITSFKDWKTKLRVVSDGGNCFFNMKVNIDKNDYYDVMVNGNA